MQKLKKQKKIKTKKIKRKNKMNCKNKIRNRHLGGLKKNDYF